MFWQINSFVDIVSGSSELKDKVGSKDEIFSKPENSKLSRISQALKGMLDCCKE
ncbi:MAG: hypothetical protein ACLFTR_05815 [Candidatus Woesearchaeota archaeon]